MIWLSIIIVVAGCVIFCLGFAFGSRWQYNNCQAKFEQDHIMTFPKGADNGTLGPED